MSAVASWVIGVSISLGSSIVLNLGMNLQKYSHLQNNKLSKDEQLPEFKQQWWVFGFSLFILGNLGNLVAFGFAAQSLLAPLGSVSLLSNAVFAPLFLGEEFSKKDGFATLLIIVGAVLAVVFGSKEEGSYNLEGLLSLYAQAGFIVYAVLVVLLILGLYLTIKRSERILIDAGGFDVENPSVRKWQIFLPVGYASIGGIIGAQTVLTAKSAVELLKVTFAGDNQFIYAFTYLIIFIAAATAISQVHWINVGLKNFDALFIVPVYFVVWTIFSILGGNLYFQEFATFTAFQAVMFALGVVITSVGVFLLGGRQDNVEHHQEEELEMDSVAEDTTPPSHKIEITDDETIEDDLDSDGVSHDDNNQESPRDHEEIALEFGNRERSESKTRLVATPPGAERRGSKLSIENSLRRLSNLSSTSSKSRSRKTSRSSIEEERWETEKELE